MMSAREMVSTVRVIQADWHRGIRSWRFWLTMGLAVLLLLFTVVSFGGAPGRPPANEAPFTVNFYVVILAALGGFFVSYWPVFMPLLAVLPMGDSLAVERRRGVDMLMITRIGWPGYLAGKVAGSAVISLAAIAGALVIVVGFSLLYPMKLPHMLAWDITSYHKLASIPYRVRLDSVMGISYPGDVTFMHHFFWRAPGEYVALASAVALWSTTVVATVSVISASWIRPPLALSLTQIVAWT